MASATKAYAHDQAVFCLRGPPRSEPLLKGPQQRRTNRIVLAILDSVLRMAPTEICKGRDECVQMIEPLHNNSQSLDKFPALLCQVGGLEKRHRRCISLEKPVVEKARCGICNRHYLLPSILHQYLLLGGHSMLQLCEVRSSGRAHRSIMRSAMCGCARVVFVPWPQAIRRALPQVSRAPGSRLDLQTSADTQRCPTRTQLCEACESSKAARGTRGDGRGSARGDRQACSEAGEPVFRKRHR